MKRHLLILFFTFLYIKCFSQQQNFENFNWFEVKHPFKVEQNSISNESEDSKGFFWSASYTTVNGLLELKKSNTPIKIPVSSRQKTGYNYYFYYAPKVDEKDSKFLIATGYSTTNSSLRDDYIIKYDTLGNTTYYHSGDLNDTDTLENWSWNNALSINNKLLVVTSKKFIWNNGASHITFASLGLTSSYLQSFWSDKRGAIYAVLGSTSGYKIIAFYSDGSFQNLFAQDIIRDFSYDAMKGIVTLTGSMGVYEVEGKNQTLLSIPSFERLNNSNNVKSLATSYGTYGLKVFYSSLGFIVKENENYTPYFFKDQSSLGKESLDYAYYYTPSSNYMQEDSTLVLFFFTPVTETESKAFVFTYKKGVSSFHRVYDFKKLGLSNTNNIVTCYVGKNHTWFYNLEMFPDVLVRITDDTIKTKINLGSEKCQLFSKGATISADSSYCWFSNRNGFELSSSCVIGRVRHNQYFYNGQVFYDANKDGYRSYDEFGYGDIRLKAFPSGLNLFPDRNGNYAFSGEEGINYTVNVTDTTRFQSIIKTAYSIGVKLKEEKPEVSTSIWLPRARCNTDVNSNFTLNNYGVIAAEKVKISLIPTDNMKLLQNDIVVDTAVFEYDNLLPREVRTVPYPITWPDAEKVGQLAKLKVITELFKDNIIVSSKSDSIEAIIRCSYDPNDKSVSPAGEGELHYTPLSSDLQYQIRFENTGNDTAYHVSVFDTLSPFLDYTTFKLLGASHPLKTSLSLKGVLAFHFDYIMLPDTATDKEKAQGFIRFSISPKVNTQDGTTICNNAAIVFDKNPPVITNHACNLLVEEMPVITGMSEKQNSSIAHFYPNPANEKITLPYNFQRCGIFNQLGEEKIHTKNSIVDISILEPGIYLVEIILHDGSVHQQKLSVIR